MAQQVGFIPGSGRSTGGRNGNLLQYSFLKNPTTESLVGYSPMGRRFGHNWATKHSITLVQSLGERKGYYLWAAFDDSLALK